jgi:hypothetical protein
LEDVGLAGLGQLTKALEHGPVERRSRHGLRSPWCLASSSSSCGFT